MKTIKIIDLLNMISKGEEVPKKIKYNHTEYIYREITKQYYIKGCMGTYDSSLRYELTSFNRLNDEVEIIEEEKKIEYLHFHDLTEPTENEKILIVQINKLNDLIKKALNNSTNR